jgi:hypothetical protein
MGKQIVGLRFLSGIQAERNQCGGRRALTTRRRVTSHDICTLSPVLSAIRRPMRRIRLQSDARRPGQEVREGSRGDKWPIVDNLVRYGAHLHLRLLNKITRGVGQRPWGEPRRHIEDSVALARQFLCVGHTRHSPRLRVHLCYLPTKQAGATSPGRSVAAARGPIDGVG